ncbi:MAG: DUF4340 domain-containing protein [Spirochaetia bacterium]|nr:DUF4340 domain-containing protein [Spirochaetia bacterium]
MKGIVATLRTNPGLSLLGANLGLLIIWLVIQDPLGVIKTGYAGASPVLRASESLVTSVEIENPEKGSLLKLNRKEIIQGDPKEKKEPQYSWEFVRTVNGKTDVFAADRDRVRDLFSSIEKAKRYYSISRTPENEKVAEMTKDSEGRLTCLQIRLGMENGKTGKLYIGKSSLRGNDSYIRVDDENDIYIVEENLRTTSGGGDVDFFRNRRIFPEFAKDSVMQVNATVGGKQIQLSRSGNIWQMISPVPAALNASEMNLLLSDILDWKAIAFPQQPAADLDRKKAMTLEIVQKPNMTDSRIFKFEVLGQKDYSSYVIRDEKGTLYEVTAVYLSHLYDPQEKLVEKERRAPERRP